MLYFIWALLNTIIFLYFLYLFFGFIAVGRRVFNTKFKGVSVFILGVGLLQIISGNHLGKEQKIKNEVTLNKSHTVSKKQIQKHIKLEENFVLDFVLSLRYSYNTKEFVPIYGRATTTGYVSGFNWKVIDMNISNYTNDKKGLTTFMAL